MAVGASEGSAGGSVGQDEPPLFTREEYLAAAQILLRETRRKARRDWLLATLSVAWIVVAAVLPPPLEGMPMWVMAVVLVGVIAVLSFHSKWSEFQLRTNRRLRRVYGQRPQYFAICRFAERFLALSRQPDTRIIGPAYHEALMKHAEKEGPAGVLRAVINGHAYFMFDPWVKFVSEPQPKSELRMAWLSLLLMPAAIALSAIALFCLPIENEFRIGWLTSLSLGAGFFILATTTGPLFSNRSTLLLIRCIVSALDTKAAQTEARSVQEDICDTDELRAILLRLRYEFALAACQSYNHGYSLSFFDPLFTLGTVGALTSSVGYYNPTLSLILLITVLLLLLAMGPIVRSFLHGYATRLRRDLQSTGLAERLYEPDNETAAVKISRALLIGNPLLDGFSFAQWLPRELWLQIHDNTATRRSLAIDIRKATAAFVYLLVVISLFALAIQLIGFDIGGPFGGKFGFAQAAICCGLLAALVLARVPWQICIEHSRVWKREFLRYLQDYADSLPPVAR